MDCPNCGASIPEGSLVCPQCGARVEDPNRSSEGAESKPRWQRRVEELKWIILAYLIASIVCMSCACLLGYRTNWILWQLGLR